MQVVTPYARIIDPVLPDRYYGVQALKKVEAIGRVSHRSEDRATEESWERFITAVVIEHGDWSITEHAHVTVEALVDRGITHEWVRHRLGAYTQESTRFVNYEKKMPPSFIRPVGIEVGSSLDGQWMFSVGIAEQQYRTMLAEGATPQIARSVFPNALASKLIVTYNLRMWRHFFLMRTSKEAHPQMREVTIPLLEDFQNMIPLLYDDIVPNSRQVDNLSLPR